MVVDCHQLQSGEQRVAMISWLSKIPYGSLLQQENSPIGSSSVSPEKYSVQSTHTFHIHVGDTTSLIDHHKSQGFVTSLFNFFRSNSTLDIYNVTTIIPLLFIQLFGEKKLGIFSPDHEHLSKINFDTVKRFMSRKFGGCYPMLNFYGSNVIYVAIIGLDFVNQSRQSFIIVRNLV